MSLDGHRVAKTTGPSSFFVDLDVGEEGRKINLHKGVSAISCNLDSLHFGGILVCD